MKKAVIFDMDGTLLRTELILEESLHQTLLELDKYRITYIEQPMKKYNEIMGVPLDEVWKELLLNPAEDNRVLANEIFQNALIECIESGNSRLYDDVEKTLGYIQSMGYTIFIASNGDEKYLSAIYKHHELDQFIENVYSINEVETNDKTNLIKHIIEVEDVEPEYIVGDRLSDFTAGRENGIDVIGCKFHFSKDEELSEADYIVESLSQLESVIK